MGQKTNDSKSKLQPSKTNSNTPKKKTSKHPTENKQKLHRHKKHTRIDTLRATPLPDTHTHTHTHPHTYTCRVL